ncbi:MAG TPA: T9SS type A sorting domain-containing protein [Ignavibacteria bacterium]|nr:T9SS type A sorting domain-containing protein [Ignavibacteria bacterium]HMR00211.1 T9SS type A sorting domain-containing protein [Ignavibacteria bacterium]
MYEIINTTDGGYIACGRDYEDINDNAFLLKIDSIGNLQWHKTFYSTYWKNFDCITKTNNNDGYLIGGFNKNFQSDTSKAILLKVNYSGDSLWQKQYELNIISNVESINKISTGYLIGSTNLIDNTVNYSILKVNEIGEILFQKSISSTNNLLILNDLKIINSNKYVIAGRYGSIGHIFIVDSNGIMLGEEFYNSPDFLTIRSILPISNGDILFAGAVDFDSVSTKRDVYALRTDSLLNAPPPIGVINMNNKIPKYFKLFQNYPNPFNPVTNIKFEIPKDVIVSIKIYDVLGREVFSFNEYKKAGIYEVQFDGSNFASGMYFYKLETDGFTDTKKMVLLK